MNLLARRLGWFVLVTHGHPELTQKLPGEAKGSDMRHARVGARA